MAMISHYAPLTSMTRISTPKKQDIGTRMPKATAVPTDKGLRIESVGISFSNDIEKKYGQAIYKVGSYARKVFIEKYIKQGIAEYFRKFGL